MPLVYKICTVQSFLCSFGNTPHHHYCQASWLWMVIFFLDRSFIIGRKNGFRNESHSWRTSLSIITWKSPGLFLHVAIAWRYGFTLAITSASFTASSINLKFLSHWEKLWPRRGKSWITVTWKTFTNYDANLLTVRFQFCPPAASDKSTIFWLVESLLISFCVNDIKKIPQSQGFSFRHTQ